MENIKSITLPIELINYMRSLRANSLHSLFDDICYYIEDGVTENEILRLFLCKEHITINK